MHKQTRLLHITLRSCFSDLARKTCFFFVLREGRFVKEFLNTNYYFETNFSVLRWGFIFLKYDSRNSHPPLRVSFRNEIAEHVYSLKLQPPPKNVVNGYIFPNTVLAMPFRVRVDSVNVMDATAPPICERKGIRTSCRRYSLLLANFLCGADLTEGAHGHAVLGVCQRR